MSSLKTTSRLCSPACTRLPKSSDFSISIFTPSHKSAHRLRLLAATTRTSDVPVWIVPRWHALLISQLSHRQTSSVAVVITQWLISNLQPRHPSISTCGDFQSCHVDSHYKSYLDYRCAIWYGYRAISTILEVQGWLRGQILLRSATTSHRTERKQHGCTSYLGEQQSLSRPVRYEMLSHVLFPFSVLEEFLLRLQKESEQTTLGDHPHVPQTSQILSISRFSMEEGSALRGVGSSCYPSPAH